MYFTSVKVCHPRMRLSRLGPKPRPHNLVPREGFVRLSMVFPCFQIPCGIIWMFYLFRKRAYCVYHHTLLLWCSPRPYGICSLVLTFIMLLIWLLPSDSTCSFTRASKESILEIRLLDKLRSSRLTRVSSPSIASMLLKDKSRKEEDSEG